MAVGYSGFAQIYDGTTPVTVLATSININPELNPINSNSVLGFGWKNAADVTHYANGVLSYSGSLGFDLCGSSVWDVLEKWGLSERVYPRSFRHSPDGTRYYSYMVGNDLLTSKTGAWCGSLKFNTSQDSVVAASVDVMALIRDEVTSGMGYFDNVTGFLASKCPNDITPTLPLNPNQGNISPIPFWKTNAQLLINGTEPDLAVETVMWDISNANNPTMIKACNGLDAGQFLSSPRDIGYGTASAIVMGPMAVTGSIQLYKHDGVWDPVLTNPVVGYTTEFKVSIDAGTETLVVRIPAAKLESDSYDFSTNSPVMRTFNLKGLGGKCEGSVALAPMVMETEA